MAIASTRIRTVSRRAGSEMHPRALVLEAAPMVGFVVGRSCDKCKYRDVCAMLVKAHLPVLCERMEREESERLRRAMEG